MTDSVDLTNCADEPIRFPGAIQPHGVLLITDSNTWRVKVASENVADLLGGAPVNWIGQSLLSQFSESAAQLLQQHHKQLVSDDQETALELNIDIDDVSYIFDVRMVLQDNDLIVELDNKRQVGSHSPYPTIDILMIQSLLTRLGRQRTIVDLANAVVREIRTITGYDRIMVYRFHADFHGEVIAEAVNEGGEPFLGLHYPESDIPQQARQLYCENPMRCIVSSDYSPVPLRMESTTDTADTIDMSKCQLRSVSPIHLEYLRNMGVGGSMSISLMDGEHLWGLIACHHNTSRFFDYRSRKACELLGTTFSLMMLQVEEAEHAQELLRLQDIERQLIAFMANTAPFIDGAFNHLPNLSDLVNAHGAASISDDVISGVGLLPSDTQIRAFTNWLAEHDESDVFASHNLAELYPDALEWDNDLRGVLAIEVARNKGQFLLCFRQQVLHTIHWAGNPDKSITQATDVSRLKPRESFAAWAQEVTDAAEPWSRMEISVAQTMRRTIMHVIVDRTKEIATLNRKLSQSNENLQSFAETAAHDLKEPLRGIDNYISFFREDHSTEMNDEMNRKFTVIDSLAKRGHELTNGLLSFSEVGANTVVRTSVPLDSLLDEALNTIDHMVISAKIEIRRPEPLPDVWVDHVLITQVLQNLLTNAIKYTRSDAPWVEISSLTKLPTLPGEVDDIDYREGDAIICIRDNGIGIADKHIGDIFKMFKRVYPRSEYGGGNGIGLAISRRVIECHDGYLWATSVPKEGSRFYFTLRGQA